MEDQRKVIMKQVNEVENTSFKINMMTNNWF